MSAARSRHGDACSSRASFRPGYATPLLASHSSDDAAVAGSIQYGAAVSKYRAAKTRSIFRRTKQLAASELKSSSSGDALLQPRQQNLGTSPASAAQGSHNPRM